MQSTPHFSQKVAQDIMQSEPVSIMAYSLLSDAIQLMAEKKYASLPVVSSQGHLIGMLSQSDIIQAIQSPDCDLEEAHVREIMNANLFSIGLMTPINEIIECLINNHIHRVLVTDKHEKLLGIISTIDIIKELY